MRSAFFMLLAANLVFMAWAGWIDRPAEARVVESATRLPRLWFAGETPGDDATGGANQPRSGSAASRESNRQDQIPAAAPRAKNQTSSPTGASGTATPPGVPTSSQRAAETARAPARTTSASPAARTSLSANTGASGSASSSKATGGNAQGASSNRDASPTQLAAALRQAAEASGQSFATSVRSASAAARCLTVGPFKDVARSGRAVSILRERGFTPKQRTENGDAWAGYWVYIGGLKSEAEQADILRKLEANGIMDAHSMPNTGDGLQVSVGLFSDRGGADRRSRSVQRLGLKADIMEKSQAGTLYWVDLNPDGSKQPVPTEGLIALEETGTRLEMKTCPRGA